MDSLTTEQDRAWVEDGIIYWHFANRPDLEAIRALQGKSLAIVINELIELAPLVVIFGSATEHQPVRIGLFEIGKISDHPLSKYLTEVWLVYRGDAPTRAFTETINKFFVQGRFHLVPTLEQAQTEAKQSLVKKISILEQEN